MENRLREKREDKRMTQEELAKASGISRATISAIENDVDRGTSAKTLIAIANALEATVDEIFFTKTVQ